ncbi:hypothetical protein AMAG_03436 [Allomyces macrogynus ATCC 38327]|uniref:Uncharacterized protein n=1 Tax=Allomyces macrogynus (strain ATCC 38327) TaxID=578462 RepID=A0A0L0S936_ALLM3|nr:hypothetical protein AMAG_03436 [Allomyces macrogynus ATCC 38327]|eukprot:KNE59093.1 hypothetical protein AMAG_03436 [Allomyces macrogynus ATCC 38327]
MTSRLDVTLATNSDGPIASTATEDHVRLLEMQHEALAKLERYRILQSLSTNIVNLLATAVFTIATIVSLATINDSFTDILVNVYASVLGFAMLVIEIKPIASVAEYVLFLYTLKGRGLLFVFLGCIIIKTEGFNLFAGIFVISMGLVLFLTAFARHVPFITDVSTNYRMWNEAVARQRRGGAAALFAT